MNISKIRVNMFIGPKPHAFRSVYHAPNIGDYIVLNDGTYKVAEKIWIYKEDGLQFDQSLNIRIEKVRD